MIRIFGLLLVGLIFVCTNLPAQDFETFLKRAQEKCSNNQLDISIKDFDLALGACLVEQDSFNAAKILYFKADCYLNQSKINEAISTYEASISFAKASGNIEYLSIATLAMAITIRITGNKEKTLILVQDLLKQEGISPFYTFSSHLTLGNTYKEIGEFEKARPHYQKALQIHPELSQREAKGMYFSLLSSIGTLERHMSNYNLSLGYYLQSLDVFPEYLDSNALAQVYHAIAALYLQVEQNNEAREYYKKTIVLAQKYNDEYSKITSYHHLARIEISDGNLDSSQYYLDLIEPYLKKSNRPTFNAWLNITKARLQLTKGNFEIAKNYLNDADQLDEAGSNKLVQFEKHLTWFNYYDQLNNVRSCVSELSEIERIHQSIKSPFTHRQFLLCQTKLFEAQGNFSAAFRSSQALININDSLFNSSKTRIVNEMQNKYDKVRNEEAISRLELENQLNETVIGKQKRRMFFAISSSLIFLSLLFIIFRQLRRIKSQNALISESLSVKEGLLREIHHRVKNNLQVISSLLFLQAEHIEDKAAVHALEEGRNRVKSMSLIHQHLYQEDNLIGVDTKTYFEKLIGSLFASYRVDRNKIKVETDIDIIELDVDTLVPIALITNELISNSLKHAFPNDAEGKILFAFKSRNGHVQISHKDNGIGLDKNWDEMDSNSFGRQLIDMFAQKLKAELLVDGQNGFHFDLKFKANQNV